MRAHEPEWVGPRRFTDFFQCDRLRQSQNDALGPRDKTLSNNVLDPRVRIPLTFVDQSAWSVRRVCGELELEAQVSYKSLELSFYTQG
jgi:hypothetical protein